jgi:hypothetical protein
MCTVSGLKQKKGRKMCSREISPCPPLLLCSLYQDNIADTSGNEKNKIDLKDNAPSRPIRLPATAELRTKNLADELITVETQNERCRNIIISP